MNIRITHFFLIGFVAILASCDDDVKFETNGDRYLPLQVGNSWKLVPSSPTGHATEITVIEEVKLHGKNYFKIQRTYIPPAPDPQVEVFYYLRMDKANNVYIIDHPDDAEINILRLGAPDGYNWKLKSGAVATVSKQEERINDITLNDCKVFFYDVPDMIDEEYSTSYASGIGYCKIRSGSGTLRLADAVINGIEYHFE